VLREFLCPYAAPNRQATELLVPRPPSLGGWKTCLFGNLQGRRRASRAIVRWRFAQLFAGVHVSGSCSGLAAEYATHGVTQPSGVESASGCRKVMQAVERVGVQHQGKVWDRWDRKRPLGYCVGRGGRGKGGWTGVASLRLRWYQGRR
jgi:hypothetical protein